MVRAVWKLLDLESRHPRLPPPLELRLVRRRFLLVAESAEDVKLAEEPPLVREPLADRLPEPHPWAPLLVQEREYSLRQLELPQEPPLERGRQLLQLERREVVRDVRELVRQLLRQEHQDVPPV